MKKEYNIYDEWGNFLGKFRPAGSGIDAIALFLALIVFGIGLFILWQLLKITAYGVEAAIKGDGQRAFKYLLIPSLLVLFLIVLGLQEGITSAKDYSEKQKKTQLVATTRANELSELTAQAVDRLNQFKGLSLSLVNERNILAIVDINGNIKSSIDLDPNSSDWPKILQLAWSPDGNYVAFTWHHNGSHIRIMNADGSNLRYLIPSDNGKEPNFQTSSPSWSRDGTKLAFYNGQICTINVDGSDINCIKDLYRPSSPAWSPTEDKIAFVSFANIYIMNPDGSDQRKITSFNFETNQIGFDSVAWSPDGKKFVFTESAGSSIGIINADGSNPILITHGGKLPSWSPDGKWIAYDCHSGSVCIIPANGSGQPIYEIGIRNRGNHFFASPAWIPNNP